MTKIDVMRDFARLIIVSTLMLTAPATLRADARADGEKGILEYKKGNLIEAMQLLEKSAAEGYAPAQTTFAFILDLGENDAQAVHWYRQAADRNDAGGLYGLGGMYAKGEGVEKDPIKAGQLIKQAAQLDHAEAMRYYAKALESGNLGFDAAPRLAAEWYQKAAERGDKPSMHRLKQAYTSGQLGLPVDADKARAWNDKVNQPD